MTPLGFLTGLTAICLVLPSDAFVAPGPARLLGCLPGGAPPSASSSSALVGRGARLGLHGPDNACTRSRAPLGLVELGTVSRGVDSRCRRPAAAAGALKAVSETGSGEETDFSGLRRALFLAIWAPLFVYCFGPWSPGFVGDPADTDLIVNLYNPAVAGPMTAIFSAMFNAFPAVTITLLSILCGGGSLKKGRQPVPPQPFVFGAMALGFFAVAPYLALRNYLPEMEAGEEPTLFERFFTSKLLALPVLGASVVCVYNFIVALSDPAAVSDFSELFWVSKAAHVTTLDLTALSVGIVEPLCEDMRRRGWELEPAKVALFSVPVVGPTLWLLVRPAVVRP